MGRRQEALFAKILEYIDTTYNERGYVPSYSEIAKTIGVSKSSVGNYIVEMKNRGLLVMSDDGVFIKTNRMEKTKSSTVCTPVVGVIACGTPILAEENIEKYIYLPTEIFGRGSFFILQAKGDSMINAGINDGDLVVIKQQSVAENGQIVVALIDDEATLKRYFKETKKSRVRLHPENDKYEDIYVKQIEIQGIAIKVIKDIL